MISIPNFWSAFALGFSISLSQSHQYLSTLSLYISGDVIVDVLIVFDNEGFFFFFCKFIQRTICSVCMFFFSIHSVLTEKNDRTKEERSLVSFRLFFTLFTIPIPIVVIVIVVSLIYIEYSLRLGSDLFLFTIEKKKFHFHFHFDHFHRII